MQLFKGRNTNSKIGQQCVVFTRTCVFSIRTVGIFLQTNLMLKNAQNNICVQNRAKKKDDFFLCDSELFECFLVLHNLHPTF